MSKKLDDDTKTMVSGQIQEIIDKVTMFKEGKGNVPLKDIASARSGIIRLYGYVLHFCLSDQNGLMWQVMHEQEDGSIFMLAKFADPFFAINWMQSVAISDLLIDNEIDMDEDEMAEFIRTELVGNKGKQEK